MFHYLFPVESVPGASAIESLEGSDVILLGGVGAAVAPGPGDPGPAGSVDELPRSMIIPNGLISWSYSLQRYVYDINCKIR